MLQTNPRFDFNIQNEFAQEMIEQFGVIPENINFGIKSGVVRSLLNSNGVELIDPNKTEISKTKLGKIITNSTYYVSCWMTLAEVEKMKTKKLFFSFLD